MQKKFIPLFFFLLSFSIFLSSLLSVGFYVSSACKPHKINIVQPPSGKAGPVKIEKGTKFIVIGDWGRGGSSAQRSVAAAMTHYAKEYSVSFILTVGDNFYPAGVSSVTDRHWQTTYENVYSDKSLHVPWYPALGNHDHYGNIAAQIKYSQHSKRWKMAAAYYARSLVTKDAARIQLVIIDTQALVKETTGFEKQYSWLNRTLKHSTADWKIVAGHHPVYSGGWHGKTTELLQRLKPILENNGVNVYFAGHDHDLQVLKKQDVHYVISGGGADKRKVKETSFTLFQKSSLGFVLANINRRKLHLYFINEKGAILYSYEIKSAPGKGS